MLQMIDESKALDTTMKYFDILKNTGYIRPDMMSRFVLYLFLLDFVDATHRFFSEEDYNAVDKALGKLFAGSGCLLPYSAFCIDKVKLGTNNYMGTLKNRVTEDALGNDDRYTQDDYIRVI